MPGSPIFVFTDASASDDSRLNEARALLLRKNLRVIFAYVTSFRKRSVNSQSRRRNGREFRAKRQLESDGTYQQLAALPGGQFLNIHTSKISKLASLISFSAMKSCRTIFLRSEHLVGVTEHSVPVDSSIEQVAISANGAGIDVVPVSPSG